MPIRTASVKKRMASNGQALHRAMLSRTAGPGAQQEPSAAEAALLEERRLLKEEREQRNAQALAPKPSAVERMVRTHHAEAKEKPKAKKETQEAKDAKKPKARRSRAEKHAEQAAAIEAARHRSPAAAKKPAK